MERRWEIAAEFSSFAAANAGKVQPMDPPLLRIIGNTITEFRCNPRFVAPAEDNR